MSGINNDIIRISSDFQWGILDYKPMVSYNSDMSLSKIKKLGALNKEKSDADEGANEYLGTQLTYRVDFNTFN